MVIGAGQTGLAMSQCLAERAIDHVVLERGEVANTWKTERWDSLRLLTPNWQSRLPGFGYQGDDPDGYRTMPEVIDFIDRYAKVISAPVRTHTTVTLLRRNDAGYLVTTEASDWHARTVVIAAGACSVPRVPAVAEAVPSAIAMLTPNQYRNPDQLEAGGVLVVGASATGTQLADEIHRSGRPVTLAVGEHIRAPRVYRGRDLEWWMDAAGVLDERYDALDDIDRARKVPSLQLTGSDERTTLGSPSPASASTATGTITTRHEAAPLRARLKPRCADLAATTARPADKSRPPIRKVQTCSAIQSASPFKAVPPSLSPAYVERWPFVSLQVTYRQAPCTENPLWRLDRKLSTIASVMSSLPRSIRRASARKSLLTCWSRPARSLRPSAARGHGGDS